MIALSEHYLSWLSVAEENLEVVRLLFDNQKYRFAVFNLQQAGEITSKAILMRVCLLTTSEENELVRKIRKDLDLPAMSAIKWGHDWHFKLLDVMDGFIDKLDELSKFVLSNKIQEKEVTNSINEFRENKTEYKEKIKAARITRLDLNPSIDELNATILFCHQRLYAASRASRSLECKTANFKVPERRRFIRQTEKAIGAKVNEEASKALDKVLAIDVVDYAQVMTAFSQTLMVLAVVNSYLLPHESRSRYPFWQKSYIYNAAMPLVQRIPEFCSIVRYGILVGQNKHDVYRYNTDVHAKNETAIKR